MFYEHYLSLLMLALSSLIILLILQLGIAIISTERSTTILSFKIRSFGIRFLVPIYFRSKDAWRLSCYALSQGWLPPSLPLRCHCIIISFST